MSFTIANWTCLSSSLNQGQQTITPLGGSPTVINSPNIFIYGSPNDTVSEIIASGYFNPVVTELSIGDWIIGNGSDGSFLIFVQNIVNGVVTVSFIFDNNGPYLLKAANLSDVFNAQSSVGNLGFGSGQVLQLTDSDFSGGIYTLTNPCPNFINLVCNIAGKELRLPPAQGLDSFSLSQGPQISNTGSQSVDINLNSGASFTSIDSQAGLFIRLRDKSTSDGTWISVGTVTSINGALTGIVTLTSNDSSVSIIPNLSNGTLDLSVLSSPIPSWQEIQNADSSGAFQVVFPKGFEIRAYNNSPVIDIGDFAVLRGYNVQQSFTADINLNSASGKPFVGAVQISDDLSVHNVKLYLNSALENDIQMWIITGSTNGVDIQVPTGVTLNGVDGSVTSTFSLDAGRNLAQLVRTGTNAYNIYSNSIGAETLQDAYNNGDGSILETGIKPFVLKDITATGDNSSLLDVFSTTKGSRPYPSMTTIQRDAISTPANGLHIYNTTTKTIDYYDGTSWQTELSIDNLIPGSNITIVDNGDGTATISSAGSGLLGGGSAVFNISSGGTTSFSNSTPKAMVMTVASSTATNLNVNNDGSIQVIDAGTYKFQYVISGRSSSAQNAFGFYVALNGSANTDTLEVYYVPTATSTSGNPIMLQYTYTLNPGDVVQLYISNIGTLSNDFIAQQLVATVSQDLASSATLQAAYNNGDGKITIASNAKPFVIQENEGSLLPSYGVYLSSLRNIQATATTSWFQFFEANNSSSSIVPYGAIAATVLDNTAVSVAGRMSLGAATSAQSGLVVPYFSADGQNQLANIYFNTNIKNEFNDTDARDLNFIALNDSSSDVTYSQIESAITDPTTGTESGSLTLSTINAGVMGNVFVQLDGLDSLISLNAPEVDLNTNLAYVFSTGNVFGQIQSGTVGSANEASLKLTRGDQANGLARIWFQTGATNLWTVGVRAATTNFSFRDEANSTQALVLTPGSGTASLATFAGDVQSNGNMIIATANKGLKQKSAAVSAGTANSFFVTGVVLTGGASATINNSVVTTNCVGVASISSAGGTPSTGYVVTCNSGSFIVHGNSVLDTSTLNVFFVLGN